MPSAADAKWRAATAASRPFKTRAARRAAVGGGEKDVVIARRDREGQDGRSFEVASDRLPRQPAVAAAIDAEPLGGRVQTLRIRRSLGEQANHSADGS